MRRRHTGQETYRVSEVQRRTGPALSSYPPKPVSVAAFISLLAFCFCAASYKLPLQDVAMGAALSVIILSAAVLNRATALGGSSGRLLILYGIFVAFSVPTSIWLGPSISGAIETLKFLAIYFVTVNAVTTRRRVWWLAGVLVVLMTVFPGIGAIRYYLTGAVKELGRANWHGLFGNSNMVALTMLMHLPLAVALMLRERGSLRRGAWIAAIIIMVVATVLTKSRAGFLAFAGLATAAVALSRHRIPTMAVVAAAGGIILAAAPGDFRTRIATITADDRDYSATSREVFWRIAADIALSHPLTGIGVDTYPRALAERAPPELGTAGGLLWQDTHSTYLNIWAEIGTPGVLAFIGTIITLLGVSWRTLQRAPPNEPLTGLLRAGMASMVVFMVMGVFHTFHNAWFFYVFIALIWRINWIVRLSPAVASQSARPQALRRSLTNPRALPGGLTTAPRITRAQ